MITHSKLSLENARQPSNGIWPLVFSFVQLNELWRCNTTLPTVNKISVNVFNYYGGAVCVTRSDWSNLALTYCLFFLNWVLLFTSNQRPHCILQFSSLHSWSRLHHRFVFSTKRDKSKTVIKCIKLAAFIDISDSFIKAGLSCTYRLRSCCISSDMLQQTPAVLSGWKVWAFQSQPQPPLKWDLGSAP